jgi:hypothetical protein
MMLQLELEISISDNSKARSMFLQECVGGPRLDSTSWPDREPQHEMSLSNSHGREEVLTTIKMHRSAQQKNAQE